MINFYHKKQHFSSFSPPENGNLALKFSPNNSKWFQDVSFMCINFKPIDFSASSSAIFFFLSCLWRLLKMSKVISDKAYQRLWRFRCPQRGQPFWVLDSDCPMVPIVVLKVLSSILRALAFLTLRLMSPKQLVAYPEAHLVFHIFINQLHSNIECTGVQVQKG